MTAIANVIHEPQLPFVCKFYECILSLVPYTHCYKWQPSCPSHNSIHPIQEGNCVLVSAWNVKYYYEKVKWIILKYTLCFTLTVVSCNLLPTPTAVSTPSKRAHWCNSHFIHCTKIEVGDGVWGWAKHWVSGVRGGSPSPVLHRVTSDHLTRSQCWSAPSDSDLACCI